jgi:hypothetical protein
MERAGTLASRQQVTKVTSKPCTARRMIGLEDSTGKRSRCPMPNRNNVKASEPTQGVRPRPTDAGVSTYLIAAFGMGGMFPAPDLPNCIGAYMRAGL